MHIGLIGGIGPAATVYYYEQIVKSFAEAGAELHLTIAHTSVTRLSANNAAGNVDDQVAEYCRVGKQLAAAGAEAIAITSMGGHFCADAFAPRSPLPLIDGPGAVATYLRRAGLRRIGILGTRVVMQTGLYGSLSDLEPLAPPGAALEQVNQDYVESAIAGHATSAQRERLLAAGRALVDDQGAQAVLLGGTDLNLVYADAGVDYLVVDSAKVHAEAIVARALQ